MRTPRKFSWSKSDKITNGSVYFSVAVEDSQYIKKIPLKEIPTNQRPGQ